MNADLWRKLEELRAQVRHHDRLYYQSNMPEISDAQYDELRLELNKLEAQLGLPSDVGFAPDSNFGKITHRQPMLSLANAFSEEEVRLFIARTEKLLATSPFPMLAEPKMDGLSFSAVFRHGKLQYAATRGDGTVGEDITSNIREVIDFPAEINTHIQLLEVRGEVFMRHENFIKLNQQRACQQEQLFANPRNAAAGSLRQLNSAITKERGLNYLVWGGDLGDHIISQQELLYQLAALGFATNPLNRPCADIAELLSYHHWLEEQRASLPYDIDGVVYKIDDFAKQRQLGLLSRSPRWAIAHKFSPQQALTKVLSITVQVGRTGVLTPIAELQPINIGGVMVARATLHNQDEIKRKDIRPGDWVWIRRAGDVIPQVLGVELGKRQLDLQPFIFPSNCPVCGSPTAKLPKKVAVRCTGGLACSAQVVERLKHFVSKAGFDIEGLGAANTEQLHQLGLLQKPGDIFRLQLNDIADLPNWGKKSAQQLLSAIAKRRRITFDRFLYALGIPGIGASTAKMLASTFPTLSDLRCACADQSKLLLLPGVGPTIAYELHSFFASAFNQELLTDLTNSVQILQYSTVPEEGKLSGTIMLFTGSLTNMSRPQAKQAAEKLGATVVDAVSKKVNLVVAGADAGSKLVQAKNLGITVIDPEQWLEIISTTS